MDLTETQIEIFIFIFVFIVAFVGKKYTAYRRKNRSITLANTSVLLSFYSEGANLTSLNTGKLKNGLRYTALLASSNDTPGNPNYSIIYKVQLPFASTIHLLGIPKNTNALDLNVSKNQAREWLKRLVEEGVMKKYAKPVRYGPK